MTQSRTERLAPLSGVLVFVLVLAAVLLVNNYDYLPPSEELQTFFVDNAFRIQVSGYVGVVAAVFLIWFGGSIRHSLLPAEGGTGRLSAVAFGGAAVGGGLVAVAFSVLIVGGARGGADGGISPEAAAIIYDVYGSVIGTALPAALAALTGAAAVVGFRTGVWPRWLAWISAILAVGSISPFAYIFIGFDLLWILVVGIWLYARHPDEQS